MKETVERIIEAGNMLELSYYTKNRKAIANGHPDPTKKKTKSREERDKHNEAIARRRCILDFSTNFNANSYHFTLTYRDENYIALDVTKVKEDRAKFCKRLKRKFPSIIIFSVYGQGERSGRLHIHLVIDGVSEKEKEEIREMWISEKGGVYVEQLHEWSNRCGNVTMADYTPLALYLFKHWRKEFGGRRYYFTRNIQKPEVTTRIVRSASYSLEHPPQMEKYILIDINITDYGFVAFRYIREAPHSEPKT